ncbi:hypothetical protein ACLK1S_14610 [Escherichia coli]
MMFATAWKLVAQRGYAEASVRHIHSGTENNFTRNVGGFRHLYDLTKDQLFNHFSGISLRASSSPTTIFPKSTLECHESRPLRAKGVRKPLNNGEHHCPGNQR